jgi:Na+-transporting NADH:ubiquinone oxidoreductase subunit A
MSNVVTIKRGVNIGLLGETNPEYAAPHSISSAAIKPPDFQGVRFKLSVKEGDEVKAGTPLLFNKDLEAMKFCSPVSGEVVAVVRGAQRRILEVQVLADKKTKYEKFGAAEPHEIAREAIIEKMLSSGVWPMLKQRPYNVVANPEITPKAIFISGFDTAPLAPDLGMILEGQEKEFQAGIDALAKLTDGPVHLGLSESKPSGKTLASLRGVKVTKYKGPHPAGLVGVHIHHLDPIDKGEHVWTISPEHVVVVGRLFLTGIYDARTIIALSGKELKERNYVQTVIGASVKELLDNNLSDDVPVRIISGNVLTGTRIEVDGYMGFFERQITAIREGVEPELFGWLIPKPNKFSISRALPSWFMRQVGEVKYDLDTNNHGELRAFVVSGEYERVFPFDIFPVQLLKAILNEDIDAMEKLGLYEVVEEDFALCEVVCTSKINVQNIVRNGLNLLRSEVG